MQRLQEKIPIQVETKKGQKIDGEIILLFQPPSEETLFALYTLKSPVYKGEAYIGQVYTREDGELELDLEVKDEKLFTKALSCAYKMLYSENS